MLAATRRTGVYGLSGTRRADLRLDVVKWLDEPTSRQVAGRIENLRVGTGGHDYLADLAGDGPEGAGIDAEALSDITDLPLHLLTLDHRLPRH